MNNRIETVFLTTGPGYMAVQVGSCCIVSDGAVAFSTSPENVERLKDPVAPITFGILATLPCVSEQPSLQEFLDCSFHFQRIVAERYGLVTPAVRPDQSAPSEPDGPASGQ